MSDLIERFEQLRALAPKGLFRFLSIGMIGLVVDTVLFSALMHGLHMDKAVARAISLPLATCVTWTLNRRLTFQSTGRRPAAEIGRYAVVTVCAQGISYLAFLFVCAASPRLPPEIALFAGAVIATGFSYSGQRFFTFAPVRAG
jgi:putative flippase GtrA